MTTDNNLDEVHIACPIGRIHLLHSANGIQEIRLDKTYNTNENIINCNLKIENIAIKLFEGPHFTATYKTIDWISEYFSNAQISSNLPPLDNEIFTKDTFTSKVLMSLYMDVEFGKTISYAELAKLCGSPKACRAVGQAMRTNPVPLVVPCHRVISSNGDSGPYMRGQGNNIKKWLLEFETERQV